MNCPFRLLIVGTVLSAATMGNLRWGHAEPIPEQPLTFEEHIRPILKAYCFDCHGADDKPEGQLDLRLRRLLVKGGATGPAIEAGNPQDSLLLNRIQQGEMPPREVKVPEQDMVTIAQWIAAGAPTTRVEPQEIGSGIGITAEDRAFWSFSL